jgi:hypothetical protein
VVGVRLLPEPATSTNFGAVLRGIGFAYAPGLLRMLGIVSELRILIWLIAGLWMLVATVIAVRHALSYTSTWRAVGVCAVPLLGQLLLLLMFVSTGEEPADFQGMDEPPVVLP